jgi:methyl-accepting chemotaxis protein
LLTLQDSGLVPGSAVIPGSDGAVTCDVLVEMNPSLRIETLLAAVPSLIGFGATMLVSSVFGTPVMLLALLLSTFSGVVVSRSLSRRFKRLEETANTMAEGDLTLTVLDTSEDEIGQLGQTFNRMAEQLGDALAAVETEKKQVEALLKNRQELVANISHDLRTQLRQCLPIWRH